MGVNELRDSVSGIRMSDKMRDEVIENVRSRTDQTMDRREAKGTRRESRRRYVSAWQRNLVAAALAVVVIAGVAVPVKALVNSIVKERMEEMPQEEKDTYVEAVKEQETEADGHSREYTQSEKERYQELARKYQEGTFPEGAIVQVDSAEEAAGYEFCLIKSTGMFCLPERELTDEELLQIIDFIMKREYAFNEDYAKEHEEEIAVREEQEQAQIAENVEEGGITEQQAIEIATQKLSEIFDMTEDGFERNSYYDEREDGAVYCVNWTNIITHMYYYFYIDAKDGHMTWAAHSGEDLHESPDVPQAEAVGKIAGLQARATQSMKSIVGESYQKVYVYYLQYPEGSAGSTVRFYFAKEDGSAWGIAYTWDGLLYDIARKDIAGIEDGQEREIWNGGEDIKTQVVFRELNE